MVLGLHMQDILERKRIKMDIKEKLDEHKRWIIMGALVLGAGYIYGWVPKTFELFGENTQWVYLGVIALAAYLYHQNFWHITSSRLNYKKTVTPRNLSGSTSFIRGLEKQRGETQEKVVNTSNQGVSSPDPKVTLQLPLDDPYPC